MTTAPSHPGSIQASLPAEGTRTQWERALVPGIFVGVSFLALFYRFLSKQNEHSWGSLDDWGHAYVIPLISVVMLWKQKEQLAKAQWRAFWPGLAPLVLGIWCYFFFVVGFPNHMFQGASMVLCLAGVTLLAFGLDVFRIAFLPIAYLLFGITISEQVMIKITFQLQMLATQGGWIMLKLISLPGNWYMVESTGNTLEMTYKGQSVPLNVAEACSGMRMVIAFIALAGAIAVFSCKHWWQRFAVLAISVPVALFMNIIRIVVLALGSILVDPKIAEGSVHMLIGTLLLIPGMFLFLGAVWCLKRIVVEPEDMTEATPKPAKRKAKATVRI
ncbi:MAG: exosortase/archaeosortase family protein [Phycisphaerales bacterium]